MTNKTFYRVIRIITYLAILVFLIWFGKQENPAITLQMCDSDSINYDNSYLEIANEITVHSVYDDSIIIKQNNKLYTVIGNTVNLKLDDYIALKVIYHKEGWLELLDYHIAKKRRVKIYVSVIPVIFVLVVFFKSYRFSFQQFCFTRRGHG